MEYIEAALQTYIAALKGSEVYQEYRRALDELKKDPDLKRRVDDFRKRNYNFQQSEDIELGEYDSFRTEMLDFRAKNPVADQFFDAELALCKMMQDTTYRITESLDFE
ncbi:MAG: YlbF family regulator [Lachnospiraceae bacterium]|nr:YlbF family regulator [Lachnospiraceae bacterium]